MKVMRTTVATVVAATLSMSAFSVFAEASLTGAGAPSLRRCMPNGLTLTRKKP
ncbi:phosphate ABC transporter substrate-binding protein [Escherichia coli]|uniref:Phosphate ABC transporter substrate-binding protein n=1 Tax=Escherichia coli TaxID=562 RepID=A0A2X1NN31_ECOLX|nr:phosphate ABC transporter substrate-binding protein [Escherichia coli]